MGPGVYNQGPSAWLQSKDPSMPIQQKRKRGIVEGTPSAAGIQGEEEDALELRLLRGRVGEF